MATEEELISAGLLQPEYDPDAALREQLFSEGAAQEAIAEGGGMPWATTGNIQNIQTSAMMQQGMQTGLMPLSMQKAGGAAPGYGWADELTPYKDLVIREGREAQLMRGMTEENFGRIMERSPDLYEMRDGEVWRKGSEDQYMTQDLAAIASMLGVGPDQIYNALNPKGWQVGGGGSRDDLDWRAGLNTYSGGRGEGAGVALSRSYSQGVEDRWQSHMQANQPGAGRDLAEWKTSMAAGNPYNREFVASTGSLKPEEEIFRIAAKMTPEQRAGINWNDPEVLNGMRIFGGEAGSFKINKGMSAAEINKMLSKRGEIESGGMFSSFGNFMRTAIPTGLGIMASMINPVFGAAIAAATTAARGGGWQDIALAAGPGLIGFGLDKVGALGAAGAQAGSTGASSFGGAMEAAAMKGANFAIPNMGGAFGGMGALGSLDNLFSPAELAHYGSGAAGGMAYSAPGLLSGISSSIMQNPYVKGAQQLYNNPYVQAGTKVGRGMYSAYEGDQAMQAARAQGIAQQEAAGQAMLEGTESFYEAQNQFQDAVSEGQANLLRMRQQTLEDETSAYDPYIGSQAGIV